MFINYAYMKYLTTLLLVVVMSVYASAQLDTINMDLFTKYFQSNMGLSYGRFTPKVSEFTKHGVSLDMSLGQGSGKHLYGFNMNVLISNKVKEFTIPPGYEHYTYLATAFLGLFYGRIFGDQHSSHFQGIVGLNYGWLLHKKLDKEIGGYHGIVPQIEFSRSIKIGKPKYSEYQYTSQYTPMRYDPSISNSFIDLYIGYKQLLLNNREGRGGLFFLGLRYKLNKYSIRRNTVS